MSNLKKNLDTFTTAAARADRAVKFDPFGPSFRPSELDVVAFTWQQLIDWSPEDFQLILDLALNTD